ncbi:CaiB/BaiF CoA transferase family protein [Sphingomonas jeddahensis]|uniref:E-cinnamoyl-CoA:R-phenyllactate CoA transferase n=1 Tax=Sphingomonas jeddahensis TaxID=1915074 RepID=A0A1V2EZ13_9SPHN|nr:CaiB/BaiF CoA-transferase family protein [Sphingomonas jeddahensis]ONF97394.1 E-cinnamoyl-CoA:R-phenyllactate CoA transferase [Sphingomonas jeddahensis]
MSTPPLAGIRIVEFAGIGPGPFAGMMLADHGAEVIRIDRPGKTQGNGVAEKDPLLRNRKSIGMDLKDPKAIAAVRKIVKGADAIIEGFRPGVMERLGLGPDVLIGDNPKLVYGRMTGWGQYGPMAPEPGHDINYIAISGALHAFGRKGEKPTPPINLAGDFGGGGMFLAYGMLAALLHAARTGEGQVVDAAMTDGSAVLMTMMWGFRGMGRWADERGTNLLDTAAHFYDTYETSDGKFISLGAIEPQFYAEFRQVMGLSDDKWSAQMDQRQWPALKDELTALFKSKTRADWVAAFKGHDVCFAPVLGFDEAYEDEHNKARGTFVEAGGIKQPAPAPRYSKSPTVAPALGAERQDAAILRELGFDDTEVAGLGY